MKNLNLKICLVLWAVMLLLPLFALKSEPQTQKTQTQKITSEKENSVKASAKPQNKDYKEVRVYLADKKKVTKMELREYIYGVIAAEYPMLYEEEALAAGIIAANTYTRYLMNKNSDSDYDVSTDYTVCQAYVTKEKAYENWGDGAEEYDEKLNTLLDKYLNCVITYKGEPIFAAYHAISSGATEDAKNVWGNEVAYLKSRESVGDKLAKGYLSEVRFSASELETALSSLNVTFDDLKDASLDKTERGNVLTVKMKEKSVSGGAFSRALGLRSQNFDMDLSEDNCTFSVRGYGHQVGMSQNGANYLAKQGKTYKEIITSYYSGVKIEKF